MVNTKPKGVEVSVIEREEVITEAEQRARTLEAAALEIEVRGWVQAILKTDDGSMCAVGAINSALGLTESGWGYGIADKVWGYEYAGDDLYQFNDQVAKSADDVTFLLRWRAEEIRDGWL